MAQSSPKTIFENLTDQVNRLLLQNSTYLSAQSFEVRRLMQEADKLSEAHAYEAFLMRSIIQVLTGDIEQGLEWVRKAGHIDSGRLPGETDFIKAQLYTKLGYFSEGLGPFKLSAQLEFGKFGYRAAVGVGVGAYRFISEQYSKAQGMRMELHSSVNFEKFQDIARLLEADGITDEDLAIYTDVAGELIRKRDLIIKEHHISIQEMGGKNVLRILFEVDCPASERADMMFELAERYAEFPEMPQAFHVGFKGAM